jgi:hypothetical protein
VTPTPSKQATLDNFRVPSPMPRKRNNFNIKRQSKAKTPDPIHDSIETETPLSSPPKKESRGDDDRKEVSKPPKLFPPHLELSPTRQSPRLIARRSNLRPKYSLPVMQSPPLPVRDSRPLPVQPSPILTTLPQSLPITSRQNQHPQSRSPSEPTPSFYTALTSPIKSNWDPSSSGMDADDQPNIPENDTSLVIKEIPSSIPWERSPSDGIGDAWPSSQSESSPIRSSERSSFQRSQPRYEDGFRVPDPPAAKMSQVTIGSTQSEESQPHPRASQRSQGLGTPDRPRSGSASILDETQSQEDPPLGLDETQSQESPRIYQRSPPKVATHPRQIFPFRIPDPPAALKPDLDDTQDEESQNEDLDVVGMKRKRAKTITEIPDYTTPNSRSQLLLSPKRTYRRPAQINNSVFELSQVPPSMRKLSPEYINIHSTQSQSQEYHPPPGPRPTSQDLDKPFGAPPTDSDDSDASQIHSHNWNSSQVSQSPVPPLAELSYFANPPPRLELNSQHDLRHVPEPPTAGLDLKVLDGLKSLEKMEEQDALELKRWENEKYPRKSKSKSKRT